MDKEKLPQAEPPSIDDLLSVNQLPQDEDGARAQKPPLPLAEAASLAPGEPPKEFEDGRRRFRNKKGKVQRTRSAGAGKPTRQQYGEIMAFAVRLVKQRLIKAEIRKALRAHYHRVCPNKPPIHWRTCDNFIVRARAIILKQRGKPHEQYRAEALDFYDSVATAPSIDIRTRMAAQQAIDAITGILAPVKQASTDTAGNDIRALSQAELRRLALQDPEARALMVQLAERAGGLAIEYREVEPEDHHGNGNGKAKQ